MSQFQRNLVGLREANKLTQEACAAGLEIKRGRYAKWEEGRGRPKYEVLIKISRFYGISVDELLVNNLEQTLL